MRYFFYISLLFSTSFNRVENDTEIIQHFLDSDAYLAPAGTFEIDKTLIWSKSKNIDWGNCVLKPIDSIDVLYIRAEHWNSYNLNINSCELPYVKPSKTMVTIQYKNTIMQDCKLVNTTLRGFDRTQGVVRRPNIQITPGFGYTGIKTDGKSETGNSTGSANKGEIHRITFDLTLIGLNTGLQLTNDGLSNSVHTINMAGYECKRLAVIKGVPGNDIYFFYNNSYTLVDNAEKDFDLFDLSSDKNRIRFYFMDASKADKPLDIDLWWTKGRHLIYAPKYALTNNGKYNVLLNDTPNRNNHLVKENVPIIKRF